MVFDFVSGASARTGSASFRIVDSDDWADQAVPLLENPRETVKELGSRHLPSPGTTVVAVQGSDGRTLASASFAQQVTEGDGWTCRNAILGHLRRIHPHDLRLRSPVRTAVLLVCRDGSPGWSVEDGAWMWGLRDACTLHGLRCGAYVTLAATGWQVLGDGRCGRTPNSGTWGARQTLSASPAAHIRPPEATHRDLAS